MQNGDVSTKCLDTSENSSEYCVTVLSSTNDLARHFPKYYGDYDSSMSNQGRGDIEQGDWEVKIENLESDVVFERLVGSIDDGVLFNRKSTATGNDSEEINPTSFGGWVIGHGNPSLKDPGEEIVIENPRYISVLFSRALLLAKYEKELSNCVLREVDESTVERINRKYRKAKNELESQLSPGAVDQRDSVRIPPYSGDVYLIDFEEGVPSLFE